MSFKMATDDYIEFSKLKSLKDIYEYIHDFNLSMYNINKFKSEISSAVISIDSEIKSNVNFIKSQKAEINAMLDSPEIKGKIWTQDIWYKIYKLQELLINSLFRISAYKTWMIKFLTESNEKFVEFSESLSNQAMDLKKIEAQNEIWKEMFKMIKEQQQASTTPPQNNELFEAIKNQLEQQQQFSNELAKQIENFKWILNRSGASPNQVKDLSNEIQNIPTVEQVVQEQPHTNSKPDLGNEDAMLSKLRDLDFVDFDEIQDDTILIEVTSPNEISSILGINDEIIGNIERITDLLRDAVNNGIASKYAFDSHALADSLGITTIKLRNLIKKNGWSIELI